MPLNKETNQPTECELKVRHGSYTRELNFNFLSGYVHYYSQDSMS